MSASFNVRTTGNAAFPIHKGTLAERLTGNRIPDAHAEQDVMKDHYSMKSDGISTIQVHH